MKSDYAKAKAKAIAIVQKHRRHVEMSTGVGTDVQQYALTVCDEIIEDLRDRLSGDK